MSANAASMEALTKARLRRTAAAEAGMVQIIVLMCEGLHDKQIAHRLGITVHAIKHRRCLHMARHQIKNRTQLGAWAAKRGLV